MRPFIAFLMILILASSAMAVQWEESVPADDQSVLVQPGGPLVGDTAMAAVAAQAKAARRLSIRERRELGLTIPNVGRVLREMNAEGALQDVPEEQISIMVLERIIQEDPKTFATPGVDFEGLLALLERLIPLIMLIFGL